MNSSETLEQVVVLILKNETSSFALDKICAKYVKDRIYSIVENANKSKSGNWCTQEEWDKRTMQLNATDKILGMLADGKPI